jgi:NAD-dependent dihydropyrimidine dehydrogenase PreA subunit
MLVRGFSLPFYMPLQEMPVCGVFLITRDFHITIKEDKKVLCGLCNASFPL